MMKIDVSNGEIIDKLTILEIKSQKITDSEKLHHIHKELQIVRQAAKTILDTCFQQYVELKKVNEKLWLIEDEIRKYEKQKDFGPHFVDLARSVYINNDERARVKKVINDLSGSHLIEEKSYEPY